MKDIGEFYNLDKKRRKRFQKGFCLHPDAPHGCAGEFIAAHTVQRAMIERYLAEDKHVLKFEGRPNPALGAILYSPSMLGHRQATTFHGFCGFHDNALFKPIESKKFSFEAMQIALLGFRSFSRELYCKEAELDVNTALKDHMLAHEEYQTLERLEYLVARHISISNAIENLQASWRMFGDMLKSDLYSELRYYALQFEHAPVYFASAAFLPEWGFDGRMIQDLGRLEAFRGVSYSQWSVDGRATAIFCWHQTWDSICLPFIHSLNNCNHERLANLVLAMSFEFSENVVFKPSWWESLSQTDRDLLAHRVASGCPLQERDASCLLDDGLNALPSDAVKIYANI